MSSGNLSNKLSDKLYHGNSIAYTANMIEFQFWFFGYFEAFQNDSEEYALIESTKSQVANQIII